MKKSRNKKKGHFPGPLTLERVCAVPCPFGRHSRFSKCISSKVWSRHPLNHCLFTMSQRVWVHAWGPSVSPFSTADHCVGGVAPVNMISLFFLSTSTRSLYCCCTEVVQSALSSSLGETALCRYSFSVSMEEWVQSLPTLSSWTVPWPWHLKSDSPNILSMYQHRH